MRRENHSRVVSDESSSDVFVLRDKTGQVLVNPHGADVDKPVKSFNERKDRHTVGGGGLLGGVLSALDSRSDEEIEVEEWILPAGETLYVRGRPEQVEIGLVITDPGDKHFLISTRSEDELAGSAKKWSVAGMVVAGLAGVGGVVLLVVGAVTS
jgi:hypothetical protein